MIDSAKNILRRWRAKRACCRSDRVIAISHFVKEYLIEKWMMSAERVGLVYFGVEAPANGNVGILQRHALDQMGFILAAGSVRPYRGLEDVISAMSLLSLEHQSVALVIAGSPDPGSEWYEAKMRRLADRLGVSSRVIWTGGLNPNELGQMMSAARIFIMTSRVEACPNIALEAMAARARIISTDSKPMPEFFGDAAGYYPAGDAATLAHRIMEIFSGSNEDDQRYRSLSADIAGKFTWEETAKRTMDELEMAMFLHR